ncbi:MAG: M48 family metallopeptidase [Syntrophaceae bacterium]|nr:M48 family metallopeptidase [Syntrophaceae bacterium]
MTHSIPYGNKQITFHLEHVERKTLQINVCPDLCVEVKVPKNAELDKVISKVKKRAKWIAKQQRYFTRFLPLQPPRKFISGETHRYLGRQCRLKVIEAPERKVSMTGGYLNIYLPSPENPKEVRKMVTEWYRTHAEAVFADILSDCQAVLEKLHLQEPDVQIRFMKTRWGSCSKNGRITLNSELIKAPKSCIRYVVIHELCHLKEHHHSKKFYMLLEKFCSDWKEQKEKLSQMADVSSHLK